MESFDLRLWPEFGQTGGDLTIPAMIDQISIDSRRLDSPNSLFVALQGLQDGHQYITHAAAAGCRFALVRKEWEAPANLPSGLQLLRVADPLKALQGITQVYRQRLNTPIIGIVGSYGKTMVKDLLHLMLSKKYKVASSPESFNSQIGVPLSLLTFSQHQDIGLIEAAFSKPGEMDALADLIRPSHVILTHIGKKHLNSMGNEQAIANECAKMLKISDSQGWVIFPDTPLLAPHLSGISAVKHSWDNPNPLLPHARYLSAPQSSIMTFQVTYPDGTHYTGTTTSGFYYFLDLLNMTIKSAWLMGVTADKINETLKSYTPEPMRTEIWKSPSGSTFINDTYCSDPQSVDQAFKHYNLTSSKGSKVFIFDGFRGAKDKEASFNRRIAKALQQMPIQKLVLIGDRPYDFLIEEARTLKEIEILQFETLPAAYEHLKNLLKSDDVVLIKGAKKQHLDEITEAFNDSITNNQCIINLAAIASNIATIKAKLPLQTRLMVMVKALAYGTDDVLMARFLPTCGIDILGVSYVEEGAALKRAGIKTPIFVINAGLYEAAKIVKWQLEVGVSEAALIEALAQEAARHKRSIKVHLHINTGMSRLGCRPEEALTLAQQILRSPYLELDGLMTHFSSSDDPGEDDFTINQAGIFTSVIRELQKHGIDPKWKHAANSSGVLRFDFPEFNMARIGLAVYGLHASEATRKSMDLRLAFSLLSRIVGLNVCKSGETVSYGRSYKVLKETQRIAVLPIGYFDGLHRNYSGKGYVLIRGQKAPMVGRITMDYMMVDLTDIPEAAIGDPVLLFGEDEYGHYVSPEDFAQKVESIPHELITCLGPRIQRVFVYEESYEKKNCLGVNHGRISEAT